MDLLTGAWLKDRTRDAGEKVGLGVASCSGSSGWSKAARSGPIGAGSTIRSALTKAGEGEASAGIDDPAKGCARGLWSGAVRTSGSVVLAEDGASAKLASMVDGERPAARNFGEVGAIGASRAGLVASLSASFPSGNPGAAVLDCRCPELIRTESCIVGSGAGDRSGSVAVATGISARNASELAAKGG
jgi:hypothetical protein